jgi:uncharacterized protein YprB with RNaseH-like and TPR domain
MRLRDRLAHLTTPASVQGAHGLQDAPLGSAAEAAAVFPDPFDLDPNDRAARIAQLRGLIGDVVARERERSQRPGHGASAERTSPSAPSGLHVGELRHGAHGALRVVERWLEPLHCHGRAGVREALAVDPAHLVAVARDHALAGVRLHDLLILDTETTGLAGGTGTVPFLIGLAWFEGGAACSQGAGTGNGDGEPVLKVEQLFLENLGQEAPLLQHLAERLARASVLVTYNGKAFDWPLLRTRFLMSRLAVPELPPHLDLLHCARRLWSARLPNVRLTEVERSVLGLWRQDDVDGSEIPGLYHRYLRGGDPRGLQPVLEHNEHDVVALAALLGRIGQLYGGGVTHDARDLLACALLALRARDTERAARFAERAANEADDPGLRARALALRGRLHARAGERTQAISCYDAALSASSAATRAELHLALARLHERDRALASAYTHACAGQAAESPTAHGRRLGRLRRRWHDAVG